MCVYMCVPVCVSLSVVRMCHGMCVEVRGHLFSLSLPEAGYLLFGLLCCALLARLTHELPACSPVSGFHLVVMMGL